MKKYKIIKQQEKIIKSLVKEFDTLWKSKCWSYKPNSSSNFLDGTIDDIKYSAKQLSEKQIKKMYEQ